MKTVQAWYGATPHGDVTPHTLGVDEDGIVRMIGNCYVMYERGGPYTRITDPFPGAFPFSNSYLRREAAHSAAVAQRTREAEEAAAALARLAPPTTAEHPSAVPE